MRGCLSWVSYAILVNGNAKGWVKASRGLRQGDPLSSFLFTIVADVLSRMMLRAEERSLLEGFKVGRNRTRVPHLQFADDTIFFSNSCAEELQTLKSLLLVFRQISGLKVNLDKRNPIACGFWDPMIERISRRLDGWQKAYLSFGGRITLIYSCLSHIPRYFLSLFKIPASVAAKIERLQRDFLWSRVGEGLFTVKSFFIALSQVPDLSPCFPTKFVWNSQVPFKVKSFVWLVAHKKVNTNALLQLRIPYKALSPDISSQDGLGSSEKHFKHDVYQL
ncbi:putative mitochondrial protein [Vitis vinifera]|uniref:Putative mitochondrial protein n=1 Tax=Vitis vinifera TaxID=29760 RepID=A0A438F2S8_VITVI|nr:putative mitochondrial protein [Vitis vinifera]